MTELGRPHQLFFTMSDEIIDLAQYRAERGGVRTFAISGGEGDRSHLALPVWRAIHLLEGERGGIVWTEPEGGAPRAFFVLDLASDPPRTEFDGDWADDFPALDAPAVQVTEGSAAVLLARAEGRSWFLYVDGRNVGQGDLHPEDREDLLFVSGECVGLLLHRELARLDPI